MEVDTLPFGFVHITRAGIETMVEQRKDTWFDDMGIRAYDLFDIRLLAARTGYEGEDYSFCVRWREGGQKVWCDPDIKLGHIGEKNFTGCLGEELKALEHGGLAVIEAAAVPCRMISARADVKILIRRAVEIGESLDFVFQFQHRRPELIPPVLIISK